MYTVVIPQGYPLAYSRLPVKYSRDHLKDTSHGLALCFTFGYAKGGGGARGYLEIVTVSTRIQKRHKLEKRYNHK